MHNLSEGLHDNDKYSKFEEHGKRVASLLPKSMNSRITKMLDKRKIKEELNQKIYAKEIITRH
jgi:hypothetical protein